MSRVTMTMPQLGETMEHGIVATWFVQEGEAFSRGDPIIEFETDKTAVEYPALGNGVLVERKVNEGDQVSVGAPIAIVDIGDGPNWLQTGERLDTESARHITEQNDDGVDLASVDTTPPDNEQQKRATPAARRVAREHGIDLRSMTGSGRRGRVEQSDVQQLVNSHTAPMQESGTELTNTATLSLVGDIAYQSIGPDDGAPYLLLHGFAADHTAWTLLSRALARAGGRSTAVDLPGHGASLASATDADSLSIGLDDVLHKVAGHRGCHLVAHSMGALPAVQLALAQLNAQAQPTIASLTLIAPVGLGMSIDAQFVRGMAAPSSRADLTHLLRRLSDWPQSLSPAAIDDLYGQLKQGRLQGLASSVVSKQSQSMDIHDSLGRIAAIVPVRLIIGHADRILDWQDVLRVHPMVAVHHLPTAGHMPHWDDPRTVAQIILQATR